LPADIRDGLFSRLRALTTVCLWRAAAGADSVDAFYIARSAMSFIDEIKAVVADNVEKALEHQSQSPELFAFMRKVPIEYDEELVSRTLGFRTSSGNIDIDIQHAHEYIDWAVGTESPAVIISVAKNVSQATTFMLRNPELPEPYRGRVAQVNGRASELFLKAIIGLDPKDVFEACAAVTATTHPQLPTRISEIAASFLQRPEASAPRPRRGSQQQPVVN
jgi:hypothetical protein